MNESEAFAKLALDVTLLIGGLCAAAGVVLLVAKLGQVISTRTKNKKLETIADHWMFRALVFYLSVIGLALLAKLNGLIK